MSRDDKYLLRTNPDGSRQASWRVWVLVWVVPAVFAAAVAYLAAQVLVQRANSVETEGEVTHVYKWENEAPQIFYPGEFIYSPRFRFACGGGAETEATTGSSHTGWNFELGSRHALRCFPGQDRDVILAGPSEWWVAKTVGLIGLMLLPLSLLGHWRIRRWLTRDGGTSG